MKEPDLSARTETLMVAMNGARNSDTAAQRHDFVETIMKFAVTEPTTKLRERAQDYLFTAYGLTVDVDVPETSHTQVAP